MIGRRKRPEDAPLGFAELRGDDTSVRIIPELGGKIAAMEMGGRQWLWKSDVLPYRAASEGASYVETADTGGFDECFPTVAACALPPEVPAYGGVTLPDHGELWSRRPAFTLATRDDAMEACCAWEGKRLPYRFERLVRVRPDGAVEMRYAVTNTGAAPLPWLWSAHPLFPLGGATRVVLPPNARVRVWAQHGIDLGGPGAELRWPAATVKGKLADLSRPQGVKRKYACKLFVDLPQGEGAAETTIALEEGGARLEARFDAREVPTVGLWINNRGWSGIARGKAYANVALEPCIGAGDSLTEALEEWGGARTLEPGATRRWGVTWSARRAGR